MVHEPGQVIELDGCRCGSRPGPPSGRAVIVTLGPRGEAAAALQALDGRPVVHEVLISLLLALTSPMTSIVLMQAARARSQPH